MKYLLASIYVLSIFSTLYAQKKISISEQYEKYFSAFHQIQDEINGPVYGSELKKYDSALSELLRVMKSSKENDKFPYLDKALFMRITQDQLHLHFMESDSQITQDINANKSRFILNQLIKKQRTLGLDASDGYSHFAIEMKRLKNREKEKILETFEMHDDSKSEFEGKLWRQIMLNTDSMRAQKEDILYKKLAPFASISKIKDFIQFSAYDAEAREYNKNAGDAFLRLFKLYTADGEISSIADFKELIKSIAGDAVVSIWKILLNSRDFEDAAKKQSESAIAWQKIVYKPLQSNDEWLSLARNTYSYEIGFFAFQKWAWNKITTQQFDSVYYIIDELKDSLKNEPDLISNQKKLNNYRYLLDQIQIKGGISNLKSYPVNGIPSNDDELYYFLSNNSKYLAVMPQGSGLIRRFKIESNLDLTPQGSNIQAIPYTYVHWFANMNLFQDSLSREEQRKYRIDNTQIFNASDFFISEDGNKLLFVGIESSSDNILLNHDIYPYPNKSNGIIRFQSQRQYHGKTAGNPNTDIYYCERKNGKWGAPRPIPGLVNTPYSERSPTFSKDGSVLYFASEGHAGLGGYDIYKITINTDFTTIGEPENVLLANSDGDDLFFNEISSNKDYAYISSNRDKKNDFDLYKVPFYEINKPINFADPLPQDTTLSAPIHPKNISELTIIPECIRRSTPTPKWSKGYVMIFGNVYDKFIQPVKNVKVYFYDRDGNVYSDIVTNGNKYNCEVPIDMREFKVVADVFTADGQRIEYEGQEFISIEKCLEMSRTNDPIQIKKDIVANSFEGVELELPFFFNTNFSSSTISTENLMIKYYKDRLTNFTSRPDIEFICYGYADIRGDEYKNIKLSEQRALFVQNFLVNIVGFPRGKVKFVGLGESSKFDAENLERYLDSLTFSVKNLTKDQLMLLSNRRVVVKYLRKQ